MRVKSRCGRDGQTGLEKRVAEGSDQRPRRSSLVYISNSCPIMGRFLFIFLFQASPGPSAPPVDPRAALSPRDHDRIGPSFEKVQAPTAFLQQRACDLRRRRLLRCDCRNTCVPIANPISSRQNGTPESYAAAAAAEDLCPQPEQSRDESLSRCHVPGSLYALHLSLTS